MQIVFEMIIYLTVYHTPRLQSSIIIIIQFEKNHACLRLEMRTRKIINAQSKSHLFMSEKLQNLLFYFDSCCANISIANT